MMTQFIRTLTRDWDPAEHVDGRSQAVLEMVAAKSAGAMPSPLRAPGTAAQYTDMMSALQGAIAETRAAQSKPRTRRTQAKAS